MTDLLLWDADELARQIGYAPKTVRNWHGRGEGPPAVRCGSQLRWRPSDVAEWIDSLPAVERSTYELRRVG